MKHAKLHPVTELHRMDAISLSRIAKKRGINPASMCKQEIINAITIYQIKQLRNNGNNLR